MRVSFDSIVPQASILVRSIVHIIEIVSDIPDAFFLKNASHSVSFLMKCIESAAEWNDEQWHHQGTCSILM